MTFFKQPNFTNQNFEYKSYTKNEKKETKPAKNIGRHTITREHHNSTTKLKTNSLHHNSSYPLTDKKHSTKNHHPMETQNRTSIRTQVFF
jgi:hypothetical protein